MILVFKRVNIALKLSMRFEILALDNEYGIDRFDNSRVRIEHC